jgi:NAD(P)-dependent dehydrogenase (short-subunit alcohol dehydrogenase family)
MAALVNSAGIARGGCVESVIEVVRDETPDTNLKSTFFCTRAALPHLRASKGEVVNLTRALALELASDVRVNCVCPCCVDTDMVRRDVSKSQDDGSSTTGKGTAQPHCEPGEISTAFLYLASVRGVSAHRRSRE